jgi:hypothetical protein
MTDRQAQWTRRILITVLAAGGIAAIWMHDGTGKKAGELADAEKTSVKGANDKDPHAEVLHLETTRDLTVTSLQQQLDETALALGKQMPVVKVIHFHKPGNADSELLADHLNKVAVKYNIQVLVVRLDVSIHVALAAGEKVTEQPKVLIYAGDLRRCEFEGARPLEWIYKRVDEALWGLRRVGKDWRPEVKGMSRPSSGGGTQAQDRPAGP